MISKFVPVGPININDVDTAPNHPGIYAWYARPDIAKADWHPNYAGGTVKASKNLMTLIRSHSLKHSSQGMQIEATAQFSNHWRGILDEITGIRWGDQSSQLPNAPQMRLSRICDQDTSRSALVDLIQACFPLFCGPLYIGIAVNQPLRNRLRQHANAFRALRAHKPNIDDAMDQTSFAKRAFVAGFSPGELYCYVIPIEIESAGLESPGQVQDLIEATEWLLNRWSLPTLGKQ